MLINVIITSLREGHNKLFNEHRKKRLLDKKQS